MQALRKRIEAMAKAEILRITEERLQKIWGGNTVEYNKVENEREAARIGLCKRRRDNANR